jgi:hypothetical protein
MVLDFAISKPDTIFSDIDIAYVSYLAHAWLDYFRQEHSMDANS